MNQVASRQAFLVVLAVATSTLGVAGQETPPQYNSQTAKTHAGEAGVVCGQVVKSACKGRDTGDDILLTLAPRDDPQPVIIRIPAARREAFGRGWPSRYDLNVVCTIGVIRPRNDGFEIVAAEPAALVAPAEMNRELPARFAPDAFGSCDPDTKIPVLTREVKPRYTADALSRRISGTVLVKAVVKEDGAVGDISIERSLDRDLDIEAVRAARAWQFRPATYQGRAVPMVITIEMSFILKK